MDTLMSLTDTC